jgi:hypothetical protein
VGSQQLHQERMAEYRQRCAGYGFAPGTAEHAKCLMHLDQQQLLREMMRSTQPDLPPALPSGRPRI